MAFLQMKRVVAGVLRQFLVVPALGEGFQPVFISYLTSKMKGGFPVRIEVREGSKVNEFSLAMSSISKLNWEERWAFMRKLGFSHAESLSMFKRLPCIFVLSKENVQSRVEFFTVKQNFELSDIAKNPVILALSLEKRVIPRCNVLEVLYSNGLIGRVNAGSVTTALKLKEEKFIEKYVTKYQVAVPEMVHTYKRQIGLADLKEGDGLYKM
ncbi:hypothetical protein IFM89_026946 [Coptis chinensis]|uniref:Uncharacterized protein n=1 Tax=Coptis chinensis TaxID=261450 RepID=A0A835M541_9MAGN|nr:hypothetical protein IFM89_026946 [Coptis chinensis]